MSGLHHSLTLTLPISTLASLILQALSSLKPLATTNLISTSSQKNSASGDYCESVPVGLGFISGKAWSSEQVVEHGDG